MGQAKNRKDEINMLKAAGSKKINPFIIRGRIVDGKVVYDTAGLEPAQQAFVRGCESTINNQQIPSLKKVPTEADTLTMVMYLNKDDFLGMLAVDLSVTPDEAWAGYEQRFAKATSKYPKVGFVYDREEIVEMGTEMAGAMMDCLSEGGQWLWPNAKAKFEKQGDRLVVVETF